VKITDIWLDCHTAPWPRHVLSTKSVPGAARGTRKSESAGVPTPKAKAKAKAKAKVKTVRKSKKNRGVKAETAEP
jgi:hypothetical protein